MEYSLKDGYDNKNHMTQEIKEWTKIFKGLGNENRLKIIKILYFEKELSVSEIAGKIRLSIKSTSKHLIQLSQLNILESNGKKGQVYYRLRPGLDPKITQVIRTFTV